ncbi:hypothetical protein STEG23_034878 [Scotinomys teguina]
METSSCDIMKMCSWSSLSKSANVCAYVSRCSSLVILMLVIHEDQEKVTVFEVCTKSCVANTIFIKLTNYCFEYQGFFMAALILKDPGAPRRHHTTRIQEHPDTITPQGPRSTRTPSHHKDPGAPDTFTTQATRWDPGTPDAIGLGGPRCNQTILDQENPEVPQTIPRSTHNPLDQKKPRSTQTAVDKDDSRAPSPHWTKTPTLAPLSQAKMGRRQCKSAYNIIKNKTTPESSPPPTPRSDHCNADKAEENDLKKSLMKMLEEAFEEKMKNVSKEIGENTNKKLEEINKEIEEKKSKKLEEMNNEIEEKKNKNWKK